MDCKETLFEVHAIVLAVKISGYQTQSYHQVISYLTYVH